MPDSTFRLHLLGGASIEGADGPLTGSVAQPRRLGLLAILAASRQHLTRDKLATYLWADMSDESAHHHLADAIHALRHGLGRTAIQVVGEELRLNDIIVQSDVGAFRAAMGAGDYARADALYAGPLLDGFFVSGAPEFDRWVDVARDAYAHEYALALERLADAFEKARDFPASCAFWMRLTIHDPYSSRIALRLCAAMIASGDQALALIHARSHQRRLRTDLRAAVDPDVSLLIRRLERDTDPSS